MKNKIKELFKYPLLVLFFVFIFGYFLLDLTATNKDYSQLENRKLNQKPRFTVASLVSNQYTMEYEKYINDQFIYRDGWISVKSIAETALLKVENNGIAYGKDGYLFDKYLNLDNRQYSKNLQFTLEFMQQYAGDITFGIIPNSYAVLTDKVPTGLPNVNQQATIAQIYSQMAQYTQVSTLDVDSALKAYATQPIYYKTDHHWTTLGAYHTYAAYVKSLGKQPVAYDALTPYRQTEDGFYGTYFSKAKRFGTPADSIDYYEIPFTQLTIDGKDYQTLNDTTKFAVRDKYAALLHGNNGLTIIKSDNNLNQEAGKTSKVLLIKDSYGNSIAPFLTYNFDEVWVVDLRYVPKLSDAIKGQAFDDVLLLYSFTNYAQDTNIAKLRY